MAATRTLSDHGFVAVVQELAALQLPWLALGGGGYDLMAVARAWTLAYGVMLGVEWPDTLPRSLALDHGIGRLRDSATPQIPANLRPDIHGTPGKRSPPSRSAYSLPTGLAGRTPPG